MLIGLKIVILFDLSLRLMHEYGKMMLMDVIYLILMMLLLSLMLQILEM